LFDNFCFILWTAIDDKKGRFFVFNLGYSFVWLLCCYIIGAYVHRININKSLKIQNIQQFKKILMFFSVSIFLLCFNIVFQNLTGRNHRFFVTYILPFVVIMGVALLLLFEKYELKRFKKVTKNYRYLHLMYI
jgi:hypothetical protein